MTFRKNNGKKKSAKNTTMSIKKMQLSLQPFDEWKNTKWNETRSLNENFNFKPFEALRRTEVLRRNQNARKWKILFESFPSARVYLGQSVSTNWYSDQSATLDKQINGYLPRDYKFPYSSPRIYIYIISIYIIPHIYVHMHVNS